MIAFKIVADAAVKNVVRILQRVVIDQPVQFGSFARPDVINVLDGVAVDGEHTAVRELDLYAAGVHIELAFCDL